VRTSLRKKLINQKAFKDNTFFKLEEKIDKETGFKAREREKSIIYQ